MHHDVGGPVEGSKHPRREPLRRTGLGQIGREREGPMAQLPRQAVQRRRMPCDEERARPERGERARRRLTDPARGPGDERRAAGERARHRDDVCA